MPRVQRGKGTAISMCLQPGGDCSLLEPKENQKGRRCPEGMKAPVGLLSRRPVCEANAACLARQGHGDFDALEPRTRGCSPLVTPKQKSKRKNASRFAQTGCGTLRLLRALGGTRILQAAAPTAPPCIRHWRRSSPLQTRGCSPLIIPRQRSKRKKASRCAKRFFLVSPICCFAAGVTPSQGVKFSRNVKSSAEP